MTADRSERIAFLVREYEAFRRAAHRKDTVASWRHLERAHIVAQPLPFEHFRAHAIMLRHALFLKDMREVGGQMLRLGLAVIGNLAGHLPAGTTGRARTNAFAPMAVPADLEVFVQEIER